MCPQFHLIGLLPKKASAQVKIRINLLRHYDVVACPPIERKWPFVTQSFKFCTEVGCEYAELYIFQ